MFFLPSEETGADSDKSPRMRNVVVVAMITSLPAPLKITSHSFIGHLMPHNKWGVCIHLKFVPHAREPKIVGTGCGVNLCHGKVTTM